MKPFDQMLAGKLLDKAPEKAKSLLDPQKLQIARLSGGALCALLLFFQLGLPADIIIFLVSLLFIASFCMLREVAVLTDNQLAASNPLLVFGDALCLLLFFCALGFALTAATRAIGPLFMGFVAGGAIATFTVVDSMLRNKLHEKDPDAEAPSWNLKGYCFDDCMYALPIFAIIGKAELFLLIALFGTMAVCCFMVYKYYTIMAPQEES